MRQRALFVLLAALFTTGAGATPEDAVGIHTVTTHFGRHYNNHNWGLFARRDGWEAGAYYNSYRKTSVYGGYMLEASDFPLKPAVLLGFVTGYWRPVLPYAMFSVSWHLSEEWATRVEYTRNPWAKGDTGIMHLRFEHKW